MLTAVHWITLNGDRKIGIMARPCGGDRLEEEVRGLKAAGVDFLLSLLPRAESQALNLDREEDLCARYGIRFLSFPIPDRQTPAFSAELDGWVETLLSLLHDGKRGVFHCRNGIGRVTLIAACVLIRGGESVEKSLSIIREVRGCPVPDTENQVKWLKAYAAQKDRMDTIKRLMWE